jgi:signal transduction histidine kinase
MSSTRTSPDSNRTGAALADYEHLLPEADHEDVATHVRLVLAAPGPALLVWGPEAIVIAYNRAYRAFAAYRVSALERPLFKAQPEIERAWRSRLDQALSGVAAILDPSDCVPAVTHDPPMRSMSAVPPGSVKAAAGDVRSGWILPVGASPGLAKGALILLMDVTPVVEPLRRAVALVAVDLRESLVGVRVLSERLSRAPKINPERFVGDVGRILEMTAGMERTADDMTTFARFAGGTGVQVSTRPGDLGALVRAACDELSTQVEQPLSRPISSSMPAIHAMPDSSSSRARLAADLDSGPQSGRGAQLEGVGRGIGGSMYPGAAGAHSGPSTPRTSSTSWLRVNVVSIMGSWDPDAIHRIVVNLVTAARRYGVEGAEVSVEVMSGREGATLLVRGEGKAPREDELEVLIEPWKRAAPPGDRRRVGSGLGLFIARELILAHGGRLAWEPAGGTTFALRVVLPPASPASPRRH